MINLKTEEEIKIMAEGGRILSEVCAEIIRRIRPGISGTTLDKIAQSLIEKHGGIPSFQTVNGYKYATCLCINNVVVHGIPKGKLLRDGDIVGIDMGILFKGFHTDMAWTVKVGRNKDKNITPFLKTGEKALKKAIKETKIGNHVGHISKAIEQTIEEGEFSPVRALVGHGIGRKLHEEPQIPCFLKGKVEKTPLLKEGMALAIEVIYNMGEEKVIYKNDDGWTIATRDNSFSGLFEHTVAITQKGPVILTHSDIFDKITGCKTQKVAS